MHTKLEKYLGAVILGTFLGFAMVQCSKAMADEINVNQAAGYYHNVTTEHHTFEFNGASGEYRIVNLYTTPHWNIADFYCEYTGAIGKSAYWANQTPGHPQNGWQYRLQYYKSYYSQYHNHSAYAMAKLCFLAYAHIHDNPTNDSRFDRFSPPRQQHYLVVYHRGDIEELEDIASNDANVDFTGISDDFESYFWHFIENTGLIH